MKRAALMRVIALVALGTGIAVATGGVASAATQNEYTEGWEWYDVEDTGNISDASDYYSNFLGTGLATYGWNEDAFDDTFYEALVDVSTSTWSDSFYADTPVSRSTVGGVTTIVSNGSINPPDGFLTATMTTTIQGAYVRYSLAVTGTSTVLADGTFTMGWLHNNFGADGSATYTTVDANSVVVDDTGYGDPVVAMWTSGAADYVNTVDSVYFEATALSLTVIFALQAFDPCRFDDAVSAQIGRAATLNTTFGAVIAPLYSTTCVSVLGTVPQLPVGTPVDLFLDVAESAVMTGFFDDLDGLRVHAPGAPPGLQFVLVDQAGTPKLHIFGTPTGPGAVSQIVVYYFNEEGDYNEDPLIMPLSVTAVLPATGTNDDTSTLAANAAGLIALGVALLVVRRRIA